MPFAVFILDRVPPSDLHTNADNFIGGFYLLFLVVSWCLIAWTRLECLMTR